MSVHRHQEGEPRKEQEMYNTVRFGCGIWVLYKPKGEIGRVKSTNDKWVFVVYNCDSQWERFKDYTAAATDPNDLRILNIDID